MFRLIEPKLEAGSVFFAEFRVFLGARMLNKLQIIAIFLMILGLSGCTTTNTKTIDSEWTELGRVGALSCSAWPVKESEIDIAKVTGTSAGNGGFVATMRLRNGSQLPVYADSKDNFNSEKLKSFPVGRDAHVVALSEWNKEPVAFVIQNKNDRAWLEIRGVRDNRMVSRMATPLQEEVNSGSLVAASRGWWLQLHHSETDSSFVFVSPEKGPNWNFTLSSYQAHTRFATVVSNDSGQNAYVVEQGKPVDENNSQFSVVQIDSAGKFSEQGKFTLATKSGLESWSASALGTRIVLAVVRGDSMIGQASLIVAAVSVSNRSATLAWKKDIPFPDVHLGEPVWLSNGNKAFLGLIKWIDAEGSLSRVKVDASGAEVLSDVGVFPKGTVLAAGYLTDREKGIGAFRFRDNELWKYKLCKLSL